MVTINSIRVSARGKRVAALVFACVLSAWLHGCLTEVQAPAVPVSKHSDCKVCHLRDDPDSARLFDPSIDPSNLCMYCHAYQRNHHPVGVTPEPNALVDCSGGTLPLYGQLEIRCLTCHEAHGGTSLAEQPGLLRDGPYGDQRDLCFKCHIEETYSDIYIHDMLDDNGGYKVYYDRIVCLFCHDEMPNAAVDRTEDVSFRADVAFLCWRCHPPMPGEFFHRHFMKEPSPEVLRQMKFTEKERNLNLPLVPRDRITCSTCHNPHEQGVLQTAKASTGSDARGRLRIPAKEMCTGCHPVK